MYNKSQVRIFADTIAPDPSLHMLWMDLSADGNGSIIKYWDGREYYPMTGSTDSTIVELKEYIDAMDANTLADAIEYVQDNAVVDEYYVHTDNNYTDAEKSKLSSIAIGAERNVNANWNSTSGDSMILNKPAIPDSLSDLSEDSTHRVVTDAEKSTWNSKSAGDHNHTLSSLSERSYNSLTDLPNLSLLEDIIDVQFWAFDEGGNIPAYAVEGDIFYCLDNILRVLVDEGLQGIDFQWRIYINKDILSDFYGKYYLYNGIELSIIPDGLVLGATHETAGYGDDTATALAHSQTTGNPHGTTASDVGAAPALTTDQNYVSDAELEVLQDTSGVNTGDETQDSLGEKIELTELETVTDTTKIAASDSAFLKWFSGATLKTFLSLTFAKISDYFSKTESDRRFVNQNGGTIYHITRWFTPTSALTIAANGLSATITSGQFTSAMTGAKLKLTGGVNEPIITYSNSNTINLSFAVDASFFGQSVAVADWGVYGLTETFISGVYKKLYSDGNIALQLDNNAARILGSLINISDNYVLSSIGLSLKNSSSVLFSSTTGSQGTKDLGLRRISAGLMELFDGVTNGALRDLKLRSLFADKIQPNTLTGLKIGTVYNTSLTTATNNTAVTSIAVQDTTGFPATGTIKIGGVTVVNYTSIPNSTSIAFASTVIPTYAVGTEVLVTSAGAYTSIIDDKVKLTTIIPNSDSSGVVIRNAADGADVVVVDTVNKRIGIGKTPTVPIDVVGDIKTTTGTYISGTSSAFDKFQTYTDSNSATGGGNVNAGANSAYILKSKNIEFLRGLPDQSLRTVAGKYQYNDTSATADTINDTRTSNVAGVTTLQICTLGNATKGSGTWVTIAQKDTSGFELDQYDDVLPSDAWTPASGGAAPDITTHTIGGMAANYRSFDGGNIEETMVNTFEILHGIDVDALNRATAPLLAEVHTHGMPSTALAGVVKIFYDIVYQPVNAAPISLGTFSNLITINAGEQYFHKLGGAEITKPSSGFNIGDKIIVKYRRTPTDAQDTYTGDWLFMQCALHMPFNSNGSRQRYVK